MLHQSAIGERAAFAFNPSDARPCGRAAAGRTRAETVEWPPERARSMPLSFRVSASESRPLAIVLGVTSADLVAVSQLQKTNGVDDE